MLTGDPATTGHRDAPVERDRRLVRHERTAERLPRAPCLVLAPRREIIEELDRDPGFRDACEAASVDDGVGIARSDDDARNAGLDHRVGARRRAAVMRARLERDVERRTARALPRLLERRGL